MNKRSLLAVKSLSIVMLSLCVLVAAAAQPALAEDGPIGTLVEFSGELLMRSQGSWLGEPAAGLPLFSGDKIVTMDGRADLIFEDGSRVVLCHYSSLELKQWVCPGLPIIKPSKTRRRFTLYMGKLWIDTDYDAIRTEVSTPPMVAGLREDRGSTHIAATLAVGSDGGATLDFDEGDHSFVIGPWEKGIAANVSPRLAKLRQFIRLPQSAYIAAMIAQRAEDGAAEGEVSEDLRKLAWIRADKANVEDERYCSAYLEQWTPDRQVLADAVVTFRALEKRLEKINEEEEALLEIENIEEDYKALQDAEMDALESQMALSAFQDEEIGEPESLIGAPGPMEELEEVGIPQPGAFAGKDPCM